jgi:hypothetical protein
MQATATIYIRVRTCRVHHFLERTWSLAKASHGLIAVYVVKLPLRGARLRNRCDASAKSNTVSTVLVREV